MKLIIFDFEVFKHDVLLGFYVVDNEDRSKKEFYQTWDKEEIKRIYQLFKNDIWIGHNNKHYDNHILEAILKDKDPHNVSKTIVEGKSKKSWLGIPLYYFDLNEQVMVKLKITEAYFGKKIHLSEVDFNLDRKLTDEEKRLEEDYNKSDIDQTYENFLGLQKNFDLKLSLIKQFDLSLSALSDSISNISARVLGVKKDQSKLSIERPYLFKQLDINNTEMKEWYEKEKFLTEPYEIYIDGVKHNGRIGGIHGARKKYIDNSDENSTIWYLDVSGYYNLLLINYDLFSRSMSKQSKEYYTKMYYEQLELKHKDPVKRLVLKTILLSVFGAMNNQYTEYYDPHHYNMVVTNGQLFLVDLLEKLEPHITLIQSNTDGIIIKCQNRLENTVFNIISEWEQRTKFVLKRDKVKKIVQRDVNNYIVEFDNGEISLKGEALKYSIGYDNPFVGTGSFVSKEPIIISILLKEFLLHGTLPEDAIMNYINEPTLFQFICKKDSFEKLILSTDEGEINIPDVTRAFPSNDNKLSTIYKIKKNKKNKIPNLPESVFIYNDEINSIESKEKLWDKINISWYIQQAYSKLEQFLSE